MTYIPVHPRTGTQSPEEKYAKKLLWMRQYRARLRLQKEPEEPIKCEKCGMILRYNYEYGYNYRQKQAHKRHMEIYHAY